MEGALSPLDDLLDIAVAWMLIRLLGWHWAFLPSFVAKVVPGVDVVPTWTMAVLVATRGAPREEAKIEPPIIMDRPALERLAELLTRRNQIDEEIAGLIGRPALAGHIGEWIAAQIFNVRLHSSATQRGSDGCFSDPPFAGRTVNVKVYGKREGILDVKKGEHQPDFYLVLTGPRPPR